MTELMIHMPSVMSEPLSTQRMVMEMHQNTH